MACRLVGIAALLLITKAPAYAVESAPADQVARGEYLTRAANCISCHTRDNGEPFAGGVAFETSFGTLYSTNITPDDEHGIGAWRDEDFLRAMHEGIGREGEHLYPIFPYTDYTQMSRDDVLAIHAYLKTREPIDYQPPANEMTFPFNHRRLLWFWKMINFDEGRFETAPQWDETVARGAYLSEALGHCGQCHTPRTWSQGLDNDHKFAGATQRGWKAFNITSGPDGIGNWSDDELTQYLTTGHVPNKYASAGPMAEVVTDSLRHLRDEDIAAMVAYLRQIPPQPSDVPTIAEVRDMQSQRRQDMTSRAETMKQGEQLFMANCASCHYPDGSGPGGAYSNFEAHSVVRDPQGTNLIRVMLEGIDRQGRDMHVFMPAYRDLLSDEQIAALANYIGYHFGGHEADFSAEDVAAQRN
ncbi:c-type cytochrome [Phytohalomonas tamaricis]|uniref:c-type cytochrome n=1 Tax=Phytohalomonas tamaricis TaxID=2081032 RepID=UPI0021D43CA6|nr:cytochrome c [Phytohalomonas tamaricis]